MQKRLAKELTEMVHSPEAYESAVAASNILFSPTAAQDIHNVDEKTLLEVFEGVPMFTVTKADIEAGVPLIDLVAVNTSIFPSKGEARKMIQQGGVSVNKAKVTDPATTVGADSLLGGKYIHVQKGKKNHNLIRVE